LGDPRGLGKDNANIADIGMQFDTMPLNCVLILFSYAKPRFDANLATLINNILEKVPRRDYDKVGFVINHYNHDDDNRFDRYMKSGAKTEQEIQQALTRDLVQRLTGSVPSWNPLLQNLYKAMWFNTSRCRTLKEHMCVLYIR